MTPEQPHKQISELLSLFEAAEHLSTAVARASPYRLALDLLNKTAEGVHFVQIGANDGQTDDALRPFAARSNWTGLMVEPHPEAFAALESLYKSESERVKLVNKAITSSPGKFELFEPATQFGTRTSTLVRDSGWAAGCEIKRSFQVEGVPLSALLEDYGMRRVDVLQIDAEGYDFEILKSLDLSIIRPTLISYEDRHFFPPKKRTEAVRYLRQRGYKVLTGLPPDDTLALDEIAFRAMVGPNDPR